MEPPPLPGGRESIWVKRQRWAGLWNGVVIGMGVGWLFAGSYVGILPLVLGIVTEVIQRKRLGRER